MKLYKVTVDLYIAEEEGNCLYDLAHVILHLSMLQILKVADTEQAIDSLMKDVLKVAKWLIGFASDFVAVIAHEYLEPESQEVEIPEPADEGMIKLPYFLRRQLCE